MYKTRNNTAFTLIELLIVVSILAIIATAIFAALSSGINVYRKVQAYTTKQIDILLTLEKMEKDVRNMLNVSNIPFRGGPEDMSFPGLIMEYDREGNPAAYVGGISYQFNDETGHLIREEHVYAEAVSGITHGAGPSGSPTSVETAAFSYYYFDAVLKEHTWKNSWNAKDGIPKAVRIELKFNDGNKDVELARTIFIPQAG